MFLSSVKKYSFLAEDTQNLTSLSSSLVSPFLYSQKIESYLKLICLYPIFGIVRIFAELYVNLNKNS